MAEIRRGFGGEGTSGERLPWLEAVEYEDEQPVERGSAGGGRAILIGVVALVVLALAVAVWIWIGRMRASHADIGSVIQAPPGPYKEKPANPGGLQVDRGEQVAEKMGTGTDIDSPLDLTKVPEEPIASRNATPVPAPAAQPTQPSHPAPPAPVTMAAPAPAPAKTSPMAPPAKVLAKPAPVPTPVVPKASTPVAKEPVAPAPATTGGSGTVQLGALASEAKAKQVWKSLSGRYAFLAPLTMSVTPVEVNGTTLYRLRASGGDARKLCAQLKVAGEACSVVN